MIARQFAKLRATVNLLDAKMKVFKQRMKGIEDAVLEEFAHGEAPIQRVTVDATPEEYAIFMDKNLLNQVCGALDQIGARNSADVIRTQVQDYDEVYGGNRTVYLSTTIRANMAGEVNSPERDAAVLSLKQTQWGDLVGETVNASKLSAVVREFDRDEMGDPILPDDLKDIVVVHSAAEPRVLKG